MKLITEKIEDARIVITEGKNGKRNTFIEGVFLQAEICNRNGRMYPMRTMEREVQKYNENFVKTGRALGELGHPDGPTINLDRASHLITSLQREGNIVADPSAPDAFVNGIMEGKEWVWANGNIAESKIDEIKRRIDNAAQSQLEERKISAFSEFLKNL